MTIAGAPRVFEDKFKFTVNIAGIAHAKFQTCSELAAEFQKIEYREGGSLIPSAKDPGLLDWDDITLERGAVATDSDLYNWFVQVADSATNTGLKTPQYKRNFDIEVRDRDAQRLKRWRVVNAWVLRFVAGSWSNDDGTEKTIESVTLAFDYAQLRVGQ